MNFTNLQTKVQTIVNTFGQDVTIRSVANGSYDIATASITSTTSDVVVKGVIDKIDFKAINGTTVLATDKKLILAAPLIVSISDRVFIGSNQYEIISIQEINPAGVPLSYELQIRIT